MLYLIPHGSVFTLISACEAYLIIYLWFVKWTFEHWYKISKNFSGKKTKKEETILCTKSCLLQQQTKCSKSEIEKANVFNIFSRVGEN